MMNSTRVKVLTTNNLQVSGELKLPVLPGSYRSSVADILNNPRHFIDLSDVEVYGPEQQLLAKMSSLCINKPAIAMLFEDAAVSASTMLTT
jgi:hypothetical protein